jgi:hypothetical protein
VYETPNKVKSAHALLFEDEGTYQTWFCFDTKQAIGNCNLKINK